MSVLIVVDKVTAWIPFILCAIENFELNKSCLARLHSRVILVFWAAWLRWNVCHICQVFSGNPSFCLEDVRHLSSPVFPLRHPCQLNVVVEVNLVFFAFFQYSYFLPPCFCTLRKFNHKLLIDSINIYLWDFRPGVYNEIFLVLKLYFLVILIALLLKDIS